MASYFQAYFQASSMPKRLLQYALSRLEILDTDALDLENLDIAFGKNSTFEFRDVGLRLKKVEALLQLPPSFELDKARVLLLRLTIPVDIYSSPIVVEIDGVESHIRVKSLVHTNHDRKRKRPSKNHSQAAREQKQAYTSIRMQDQDEGDDLEPVIPTASDLAASFLQTEPDEEKAELQAAILSETQDLGASSASSDDGEYSLGTGTALSLPAFMARFLQGIVDRLQVRIRGITLNLNMDVPNEISKSPPTTATDPVTVQLKIENIDIEGVTQNLNTSSIIDDGAPSFAYKDGKRLICLSQIRGALISEANLFSSLARSSAMSSPSAAHSDIFEEAQNSLQMRQSTRGSDILPVHEQILADFDGSPNESATGSIASLPHPILDRVPLQASVIASDSGRFEDAPEEDEMSDMSQSGRLSRSRVGDSFFQNSAYLDQVTESQYLDDSDEENRESVVLSHKARTQTDTVPKSPLSTPRASLHLSSSPRLLPYQAEDHSSPHTPSMLQSTILPTRPHPRFSEQRVSQSQPTLPAGLLRSEYVRPPQQDELAHSDELEISQGDHDDDQSSPQDDLAQSQLFSHEDAESMYMSAISHTSSTSKIPGGWGHSSSGSDKSFSASAAIPQSREKYLDNLEHARHVAPDETLPPISSSHTHIPSSPEEPIKTPGKSSVSPVTDEATLNPSYVPQGSSGGSERSATSSDEYSRLTKQVFSLDRINVYLPPVTQEEGSSDSNPIPGNTFDGQSDTSKSTTINVPGSFSTHLPPQRSSVKSPMLVPVFPAPEPKIESGKDDRANIEINFGRCVTQFDVSVGRLIYKIVHQLMETIKVTTPASKTPPRNTHDDRSITLDFEEISIHFLERLEGILGPYGLSTDNVDGAKRPSADVLLRTTLRGLHVDSKTANTITKTSISLKKFAFGYARQNIISFDAALKMRSSVRDLDPSDGIDICINVIQGATSTRCEITTLPVHISVDLQKLDETFSWFGGLSSVLNLGSSIASNTTVTASSPSKPKPRGVRFETPIRPDDKSSVAQNKADVRVGGFVLDLIGTDCSIGVETSAVKVVSRDEGIGIFIQKIRISGPHLKRSDEEPAINVDITSTRIEYLTSPKDTDLDRLLSLITPSKAKYDQDDDILLDTLLRQRKQGAVVRLTIDDFKARIGRLKELNYLPELGEEVSRLSTVAKYLPDDDRPGLLSLVTIKKLDTHVDFSEDIGIIRLASTDIEVAQITLPSLVALSVSTVTAHRNSSEVLLGPATEIELREPRARAPAIMARMIGDEMEPIIKIKLWNLQVEYRVPTLMVLLGLAESANSHDLSASVTASVATLTGMVQKTTSDPKDLATCNAKPMTIDVVLRDCILGLNPLGLPSKLLVVLTEAHLIAVLPKDGNANASMDLSKASLLVVDNVAHLTNPEANAHARRSSFDGGSTQVADLCATGYVSVSYISSARALLQMTTNSDGEKAVDVELRDDLFVLESCADSTQTLVAVLSGLSPPTPPSKEIKYRTKVVPVQDLLASLSGDAFGTAEGEYNFDDDFGISEGLEGDFLGAEPEELDFDSHYYLKEGDVQYEEAVLEGSSSSVASARLTSRDTHDGVLLDSFTEPQESLEHEDLDFQEDHFGTGSILEGTAHRWNSAKNTYDRSNNHKIRKSPLKLCVRDVHIIWNLFDGYDWQHTRDTITKAVQDVESKAIEKRARNERRPTFDQDIDDEETVIGDFLFNSIYIGIPANRDPRELSAAINQELNDNATETESIATTTVSSSPSRQGIRKSRGKRLRLNRSKHHKITFELKGVSVDLVAFPPGSGETQSSIDIRVHDVDVFDHVPTSTWRKFATYMQEAGERETGTSMIHIEILNVKPIPELAASEIVLKATILPLRLHVDQDALDFITRFFEFKDDSAPTPSSPGDAPFLQRVEVNSVQVKLDFKPKRVDYAGLRSGHTTEFMNFLILDEADMVLRHTIIYGISGFEKLGKCLNDIWMPDIKRNQLPGILAGLAPVRSVVNVGGGVKDLFVVPMREYRKDGRIVRGLSKGATAFAKTTGTELVKLGAKVAVGVQTVLQGAEGILGPANESSQIMEGEDSEDENKQISLYANQPVGVLQGLRGGYAGLQRDLVLARDAIIAVPGEVMESGNAAGVLRAVRKHAPTVILRPAIGLAKAGGQILMGATNSLDPVNIQRAEAKYKKH